MSNPRWERLKESLAASGVEATIDTRAYPGGRSYSMAFSLGRPGWTVEVKDQWWRKNLDVWLGWEVGVVNPEGVWVREWPLTKKRSEVVAAVIEGLAHFTARAVTS